MEFAQKTTYFCTKRNVDMCLCICVNIYITFNQCINPSIRNYRTRIIRKAPFAYSLLSCVPNPTNTHKTLAGTIHMLAKYHSAMERAFQDNVSQLVVRCQIHYGGANMTSLNAFPVASCMRDQDVNMQLHLAHVDSTLYPCRLGIQTYVVNSTTASTKLLFY